MASNEGISIRRWSILMTAAMSDEPVSPTGGAPPSFPSAGPGADSDRSTSPTSDGSNRSARSRGSVSWHNLSTPTSEKSEEGGDYFPKEMKPSAQTHILVVGGLGYIGSHTTWELLKAGHNVVIIDNLSNSFRRVLDLLIKMRNKHYQNQKNRPSIDFYEVDYRDQSSVSLIIQKYATPAGLEHLQNRDSLNPRASIISIGSLGSRGSVASGPPKSTITGVIHFAAYKAVAESIRNPLKYYSNNVAGLVDFCVQLGNFGIKNLVFSSSATVYGEHANKGGRLQEEICSHQTTTWTDSNGEQQTTYAGSTGITNPYGRTKWMCEAILNDLALSDGSWTIIALRYFNPVGCDSSGLLGEDPRGVPNNLMPVVVNAMTRKMSAIQVYGTDWDTDDGTAIRDFIHVSDLARGHVAALAGPKKGFHTFNLGSGSGHSVKEVVETMEKVSGRTIPTRTVGRRDGDVAMCIAEPSKAFLELGWKPEKSLQDSCHDIVNFLTLHAG